VPAFRVPDKFRGVGLVGLGALTLFLVVLALTNMSSGQDSETTIVERRVFGYAENQLRDLPSRDLFGPVVSVSCEDFFHRRYRESNVYSCNVVHANKLVIKCAAIVDGALLTQDRTRGLPCWRPPWPRPLPPQS
jgi:hypothetical protein